MLNKQLSNKETQLNECLATEAPTTSKPTLEPTVSRNTLDVISAVCE